MVKTEPDATETAETLRAPRVASERPAVKRTKLEETIVKTRIVLRRYIDDIHVGKMLSEESIKQLGRYLYWLGRLGREAKPALQQASIAKNLKRILRHASILPDYLPPHIEMLLASWSRDEYSIAPTDVDPNDDDSDHSSASKSETNSGDDMAVVPSYAHAMRGIRILLSESGRRVYTINPAAKRPSSVFGHNGLKIGDWWPRQICMVRDGAHGSFMGGIAGKVKVGAYSVLIAGALDYAGEDSGDIVMYTGSGDSRHADRPMTKSNEALRTRNSRQTPVRVFRSSKERSKFAPSQGYRSGMTGSTM
jgi:hypothetical protein